MIVLISNANRREVSSFFAWVEVIEIHSFEMTVIYYLSRVKIIQIHRLKLLLVCWLLCFLGDFTTVLLFFANVAFLSFAVVGFV